MNLSEFIEEQICKKFPVLKNIYFLRKILTYFLCWYFRIDKMEKIYEDSGYYRD
jgi:hypothetical protein